MTPFAPVIARSGSDEAISVEGGRGCHAGIATPSARNDGRGEARNDM